MEALEGIRTALSAGNLLALPLALLGGLVAGLNPCCLALYPAAATACCSTPTRPVARPIGNAAAFLLGLAFSISLLGTLAVLLGRVAAVSAPVRYAIAVVPILFGLSYLGWLRLPRIPMIPTAGGLAGAFATGLLLSLIIGPCGTPVLAAVLSYAVLSHNLLYAAVLLFLFGIGSGLPVMAVGTAVGTAMTRLSSSRVARWLDAILGASLVALGLYLLWRA